MPLNLIHYRPEDGGSGTGDDGGNADDGAGTGNGASQEDTGSGSGSGSGTPTVESLQAELKKTRDEAAKNRRERNAAQKRIEELEGATKSDVEKLTDGNTKLTQERDDLVAKNRRLIVRALGPKAGIAQSATADAADLFRPSENLDWDDEEAVVNELRAFVKERPHLAGRGTADGGEGGNRQEGQDMNSLIRAAAGRG